MGPLLVTCSLCSCAFIYTFKQYTHAPTEEDISCHRYCSARRRHQGCGCVWACGAVVVMLVWIGVVIVGSNVWTQSPMMVLLEDQRHWSPVEREKVLDMLDQGGDISISFHTVCPCIHSSSHYTSISHHTLPIYTLPVLTILYLHFSPYFNPSHHVYISNPFFQ